MADYGDSYWHLLRARQALPDRARAMLCGIAAHEAAPDCTILTWFNSCEIGAPMVDVRRLLNSALRYAYRKAKAQHGAAFRLPPPNSRPATTRESDHAR